ncbi:hypothetical protein ABZ858_11180 [Streptomyces sp. NPDC047017]|uniref:hypothetical protein n=1 Tax=Streptomyces sp. NPDC047017 TaxID=3155024 RepID=UPI0033DF66F4
MELRGVEELMDLLHAGRGPVVPVRHGRRAADPCDHALRTAALLRRHRPADKELQVAALVLGAGRLLGPVGGAPADEAAGALRAADAVRGLLGERVHRLVRQAGAGGGGPCGEDALALRQAAEECRLQGPGDGGPGAGDLEDWRTVLARVAAGASRRGAVDH